MRCCRGRIHVLTIGMGKGVWDALGEAKMVCITLAGLAGTLHCASFGPPTQAVRVSGAVIYDGFKVVTVHARLPEDHQAQSVEKDIANTKKAR